MESPIRVLVVHDHYVVRAGVRALLAGLGDITVAGEAEDGRRAEAEVRRCDPRVILTDLNLPRIDGVAAIRRFLAVQPEVGIVVIASPGAEPEAEAPTALETGALGYLAKTSRQEEFAEAIRRVARGEAWLPPELTRRLLAHLKPRPAVVAAEALTAREREVLGLLARGRSNREIARELGVAEITARTHVSHIFGKLATSNRVEAALHALRMGLVPQEAPRAGRAVPGP